MTEQPYLKIELEHINSVPKVWINGEQVYTNTLVSLGLLWSTKGQDEPYPNIDVNLVGYNDSLDYPLKETIHLRSGKYIEGDN